MSNLSAPYLHDKAAAYEFVESVLWPDGPVCPHCGCMGNIKVIPANPEKRVRHGLKRCGDCKKQFTVKVGTVFEDSKVPLHLWVQAVVLMTASKKGISSHQLHRTLGVTYKTAWFMSHCASARLCGRAILPRSALMAALSRLMRRSSAMTAR